MWMKLGGKIIRRRWIPKISLIAGGTFMCPQFGRYLCPPYACAQYAMDDV